MAWYNTYRPQTFTDVIGQDLVKTVLQNALEKNIIKHAYLLSGPKGTGKTTLARIFANSLNQINQNPQASIDIIEMDAASNTGIDDIRQLIESSKNPPIAGKYKVYIIDEVHMLSKAAMNALLKILEEPPTYLVFLLATTNPEKLIPTVLSRLTKLQLTNHSIQNIVSRLQFISTDQGVSIENSALELIAKRSGGGQRDAINLLETVASYGLDFYSETEVASILGVLPSQQLQDVSAALLSDSVTDMANISTQLSQSGIDGDGLLSHLLEWLLDESFAGKNQFDGLIIPVSQVISLKLPLAHVASALSVVRAYIMNQAVTLKPANGVASQQNTQNSTTSSVEKKTTEVEKFKISTNKFTTESVLNSNAQASFTVNPQSAPNSDTNLHSQQIQNPESATTLSETKNIQATKIDTKIEDLVETKTIDTEDDKNTQQVATQAVSQTDDAISGVEDCVKNLVNAADCPATLKMLFPDLGIEYGADNGLVLSVSSGMFQSVLNSEKLQQWIADKVASQCGVKIQISAQIRSHRVVATNKPVAPLNSTISTAKNTQNESSKNDNPASNLRFTPKNQESENFDTPPPIPPEAYGASYSQDEQTFSSVNIQNTQNTESQQTSSSSSNSAASFVVNQKNQQHGDHFYRVYKRLPENMEGKGVQIKLDDIPLPQKTERSFEEEAEDMFEFE